jgi:predicted metal-dependent phosphoesterase TrpH
MASQFGAGVDVMALALDLHVHTTYGASDSQLDPDDLARIATDLELGGVTLTEHDRVWERHALAEFSGRQGHLFVVSGMEVSTDLGHILAYGLPQYVSGIRRATELRRVADEYGAFLVAAHPFRHWFEPVTFRRRGQEPPEMIVERLAHLPLLQLVDGLEVLNGANTERENRFALEMANYLGKPGTGGSDAHSTSGIGSCTTLFSRKPESLAELVRELKAGRFYAAKRMPGRELQRFTLEESDGEQAAD